ERVRRLRLAPRRPSTAGGSPSDRPVLSGGSTALLRRTGPGRILGSVTAASGATRRSPELLKEKLMEEVEQSGRRTDRRSFLVRVPRSESAPSARAAC